MTRTLAVTIDVVCCFDDNLAIQVAIMAASMAAHASTTRPVVLHAFFLGEIKAIDLEHVARQLKSQTFALRLHAIANPFDEAFPIASGNPSYYLRLAIVRSIDIADRIIYLDADTLVRGDLSALFDTDLGTKAFAACTDVGMEQARLVPRKATNVLLSSIVIRDYVEGLVGDNQYFNSGVMVIDVPKWRAADISGKCLQFIEKAPHVFFADQDALNHVMQGDIALLDHRWNCIPMYQANEEILLRAGIVHYAGFKPWKTSDQAQLGDQAYWEFAMSTPYGRMLRSRQMNGLKWQYRTGSARLPSHFKMLKQAIQTIWR